MLVQAQIALSLPDTSVKAGEVIDLPVYVDQINASDGVIAGELEFSFNNSVVDVIGFNKTGTLLESVGSVVYFEGTDRLAFASTDTVSGSGVLVYLKLKGVETANYFQATNINFDNAVFNEGSPTNTTTNGRAEIEGVRINPKSSIQIVKGSTQQFTLNEYVTAPVTWSVTDTSIASIDSNGLLTAKTTGTIQVKGTDAEGLADSTQFFKILPQNFSDLTVEIPDSSTTQTLTIDLPVRVTDLTGLGVLSTELDISFSQSHLTLLEVIKGDVTSTWGDPAVNIDNNRVQIAAAGSDTLAGAGVLYYLQFKVNNTFSGTSYINLNSSAFNEDLSATLENGALSILSAPDIQVFPGDTAVSIGNTLQFSVTNSEGTAPYTWESSGSGIASINVTTGLLTGVSRGDITVQARDAENFPSDLINIRVNDFDAYLDSALLVYPDTVSIGLFTSDLTAYGISSFETEFKYDSTRLEFIGIDVTDTQTGAAGLSVEVRDTSDVVKIAAAGTSTLTGTNSIINLKFAPTNNAQNDDSIKLDLMSLTFNEPSPSVPTVTTIPGEITIQRVDPPEAPVLATPVDAASPVDTLLAFDWSDATGADTYQFQLADENTFAAPLKDTVLSASAFIQGTLEFETIYYWRVRASNVGGDSPWSSTFSFTTKIDLPEAPVLLTPVDAATDISETPDLVWFNAARADSFFVELSEASDFSTTEFSEKVADTTASVTGLMPLTEYFWRVKSKNLTGESSWSATFSFTTAAVPAPAITPLMPTNGSSGVDTMATLSWGSDQYAAEYLLQFSTASDFGSTLIDESTTDTTKALSTLSFATEYFWRVRSVGFGGDTSAWSSTFSFTTGSDELPAPILLSPGNGSTDLAAFPTLIWTSVTEANEYQLEVTEDTTVTPTFLNVTVTDTTQALSSGYSKTLYWRVKSRDTDDPRESVFTPWFMFSIEDAPDAPPVYNNPITSQSLNEDFGTVFVQDLKNAFEDAVTSDADLTFELVDTLDVVTAELRNDSLFIHSVPDAFTISSSPEFLYVKAFDELGQEAVGSVQVQVFAVNDLPFVVDLPDTISFESGETFELDIDEAFDDVEDTFAEFSIAASGSPSGISASIASGDTLVTLTSPSFTGFGTLNLTVTDSDGGEVSASIIVEVRVPTSNEMEDGIPSEFTLNQNYPNPFNPSSTIRFGVPEASEVRLDVFNMLGQNVATLVNGKMQAGWHTVQFQASGLSTGTYIYRLQAGDFVQTKKMMLIK
jgi:hypothetical protein